ncbi:hypothetical protein FB451DRAFT_1212823 [Mycena latifolia]|nr:hypothetical protein FB451DRAFT_1212823 [Mycena latifolia]
MAPDPARLAELLATLERMTLTEEHSKTKRPNKHTDRVGWNNHFERAIELKYQSFAYDWTLFEERPDTDWAWNSLDIGNVNQDIALRLKEMMRGEGYLLTLILDNLVYGDFEAKWIELPSAKKREIVLEGLYRGACSAPRDNSRISCPEMTVAGLIGDGEYNLLNMLKRLVAHDPTGDGYVNEVYLFIHPYTEHEFRTTDATPDVLKGFIYDAVLLRNFYIVETLIGILEVFYNRPAKKFTPAKFANRVHTKEQAQAKEAVRAGLKRANLRVDKSQEKELSAIAEYGCYSCCKTTKSRNELLRCSRCKLVWYCSKECQKVDWKAHKRFCGQRRFDPKLLAPPVERPTVFIGCPLPVPGFIRTPALWRQIWYLSKPDSQTQEYHFNLGRTHTRSIAVINPYARLLFLVARRRAMASGSLPAIYKMLEIIERQREEIGLNLTPEQIRRQFEIEYTISITPEAIQSAAPFDPPTTQELGEEHSYILQREATIPIQEE